MDGTYGNVFPTSRAMPPALGTAPSSANDKYKVNVSRQKTRKWANFRPQNYDGDDWGDEYEEEEEAEQPAPPPVQKPQGPRMPATTPSGSSSDISQYQRTVTMPVAPQQPAGARDSAGSLGSLGSLPSQAQPRKNSTDAARPPGLPWLARSAVPPGAPSPSTANSLPSPGASGRPFVRPADIYRKLEEEKRRSLEFKPSPAAAKPEEAATKPEATNHQSGAGGGSDVNQGGLASRPALASVAERKSEYGLEGLLDSYGSEEHNVEPSSGPQQLSYAPVTTTIQAPKPLGSAQEPPSQAPGEGLRRFSTSPQLPLVTRMSGFGEDLFSPSNFFDQTKQQPPILENTPIPAPINTMVGSPAPTPAPAPTSTLRTAAPAQLPNKIIVPVLDPPPNADVQAPQHVSSETTDKTIRSASPLNQPEPSVGLQDSSSAARLGLGPPGQPQPVAGPLREAASSKPTDESMAIVRPLLPGSWVTENPVTPAESLLPSRTEPNSATTTMTTNGPGESRAEPAVEGVPFKANNSRQPSPERADPIKEIHLQTEEKAALSPSRSASPTILPPLRTLTAALNTPPAMASGPKPDDDAESSEKRAFSNPGTPVPNSATSQNSEITPTAPLNPRREPQDANANANARPALSSPSYGIRGATQAETESPLKESDALTEEIMKSLSPVQPSEKFATMHGDATAAYHAAAEPVRESSYLGDVYDDYWTATEEKTEPKLFADIAGKPAGADKAVKPPAADPTEVPKQTPATTTPATLALNTTAVPATTSGLGKGNSSAASPTSADRRRFSWEAGFSSPVPVNIKPVDPTTLASGNPKLASPTVTSPPPSPGAERRSPAPESKPDSIVSGLSAPVAGLVSHQVSQASLLGPRLGTPAEPPSPISVLSEKEVAHISPPPASQGLPYTDEKIAVEKPPIRETKASPAPSHEKQVVLPEALQKQLPQTQAPPPQQLRKGSINVLPFRAVLEMGSPADRIKHFNESRSQFAAMDTGLDDWLVAMLSRHPEHRSANAPGFAGQQSLQSPAGQPPQLQPSGPAPHGIPAKIPMPPLQQHGTGGFGHLHSTNQVGTKSKELLMAAGKAGKGLFSKGRNKLRGTGDKAFPNS